MKKNSLFDKIVQFIRKQFNTDGFIPLHIPVFTGNEKKYLNDCIDTGFVSSVGAYVTRFEEAVRDYVKSGYAVAAVNGTAALQVSLMLAGVEPGDEVLTQPVSFVATSNAISYCGAHPVFLDVEKSTFGLSPDVLSKFLEKNTTVESDGCYNKSTRRKIAACVPVHVFGHPVSIMRIVEICENYSIPIVEDSAESVGSTVSGVHTGRFGCLGIFSFNGNKTITTGGGGMIVTDDEGLSKQAKHITTTAKVPHQWEYVHDKAGFNYRLPNINAALGCAQMENLPLYLENKRELAEAYRMFFQNTDIEFFEEKNGCRSNYWLNAIILRNREEKEDFLQFTNDNGIMTRPMWRLTHKLPMYKHCQTSAMENAEWLEDSVVNIPSSVRI